MIVLGIETSCDETSVAILKNGQILSNRIYSQITAHREFGGVVPEVAARNHCAKLPLVFFEALSQANVSLRQIEGIAVTSRPGLVGALLTGLTFAKSLSFARNIPLKGINHLEAHWSAISLETAVDYPYLALLVSGGHTSLYKVQGVGKYFCLGSTRDDAAGEVFDKVARIMNLGYPGGPAIDQMSAKGDREKVSFPRPMLHSKDYHFSFSGLKTAVQTLLQKNASLNPNDIAASFNKAVADVLTSKTLAAARDSHLEKVVVAGGVACNSMLRRVLSEKAKPLGIEIYFPSPPLCTDNAAMIAHLGEKYLAAGIEDDLSLDAAARAAHSA